MGATFAQRQALGRFGERLAVSALEARGLVVLDRNWRCAAGELDIVARDGAVLVACEVKTRRGRRYGAPIEAVTPRKAERLHRLIAAWALAHDETPLPLRVDVVCVEVGPGPGHRVDYYRGLC